jgi:hypothetical protein
MSFLPHIPLFLYLICNILRSIFFENKDIGVYFRFGQTYFTYYLKMLKIILTEKSIEYIYVLR